MQTDSTDFDFMIPERPKFLRVLCTLTFICSAWIICTNIFTYITAKDIVLKVGEEKLEIAREIQGKDSKKPAVGFAHKVINSLSEAFTVGKVRTNALGIIIAQLFCLIGAILMWKLKKIGYPFYILGIAIGITVPFYLFGNNFIAVSAVAFTTFFGLIFVVFYGMNLKAMNSPPASLSNPSDYRGRMQ